MARARSPKPVQAEDAADVSKKPAKPPARARRSSTRTKDGNPPIEVVSPPAAGGDGKPSGRATTKAARAPKSATTNGNRAGPSAKRKSMAVTKLEEEEARLKEQARQEEQARSEEEARHEAELRRQAEARWEAERREQEGRRQAQARRDEEARAAALARAADEERAAEQERAAEHARLEAEARARGEEQARLEQQALLQEAADALRAAEANAARTLAEARDEAFGIIRDTEAKVIAWREHVEQEAAVIRADAERLAEETLAAGDLYATERKRTADDEAALILRKAEERARTMLESAQPEAHDALKEAWVRIDALEQRAAATEVRLKRALTALRDGAAQLEEIFTQEEQQSAPAVAPPPRGLRTLWRRGSGS